MGITVLILTYRVSGENSGGRGFSIHYSIIRAESACIYSDQCLLNGLRKEYGRKFVQIDLSF